MDPFEDILPKKEVPTKENRGVRYSKRTGGDQQRMEALDDLGRVCRRREPTKSHEGDGDPRRGMYRIDDL